MNSPTTPGRGSSLGIVLYYLWHFRPDPDQVRNSGPQWFHWLLYSMFSIPAQEAHWYRSVHIGGVFSSCWIPGLEWSSWPRRVPCREQSEPPPFHLFPITPRWRRCPRLCFSCTSRQEFHIVPSRQSSGQCQGACAKGNLTWQPNFSPKRCLNFSCFAKPNPRQCSSQPASPPGCSASPPCCRQSSPSPWCRWRASSPTGEASTGWGRGRDWWRSAGSWTSGPGPRAAPQGIQFWENLHGLPEKLQCKEHPEAYEDARQAYLRHMWSVWGESWTPRQHEAPSPEVPQVTSWLFQMHPATAIYDISATPTSSPLCAAGDAWRDSNVQRLWKITCAPPAQWNLCVPLVESPSVLREIWISTSRVTLSSLSFMLQQTILSLLLVHMATILPPRRGFDRLVTLLQIWSSLLISQCLLLLLLTNILLWLMLM